jgi:hypothetical protein
MKKTKIFASIVVATMLANVTAKAETVSTTKTDSNNIKTINELSKLLVNGQEKELSKFINVQAPSLASSKEGILVNRVISLYNNNSSAFFNLSDSEKAEFNSNLLIFIKKLESIKTKDANNWLIKLKYTVNTINFLWAVNNIEVLDTNQEINIDAEITAL